MAKLVPLRREYLFVREIVSQKGDVMRRIIPCCDVETVYENKTEDNQTTQTIIILRNGRWFRVTDSIVSIYHQLESYIIGEQD